MARKGHTKSRKGCSQCKKRHIKCDERRPECQKCISSARQCSFTDANKSPDPDLTSEHDASTHSLTPVPATFGTLSGAFISHITQPSPSQGSIALTPESMLHVELFYNFDRYTCRTFLRTEPHIDIYRRTIMSRIFQVPYLMQTMLGLSALHLSLEKPDQKWKYKHAADVLQSQALESFDTGILRNVNEDNVLDLLLFQHLTAHHAFCDTFTYIEDDFGDFMEKLTGCIQLLRGVNSVTVSWWNFLSQTELGIVMQNSDEHQNTPHDSRRECDPLLTMIDNADLSTRSIEVCRASIEGLQGYFDAENDLGDGPIHSTNMLFAWLIVASPEYTALLSQRRPEALIILAYYAVLLFRRRRSWAVANSGRNLLRHIKNYLGSVWEPHLAWPHNSIFGASTLTP